MGTCAWSEVHRGQLPCACVWFPSIRSQGQTVTWSNLLRSAVGKTHDLRSDLWWTIPLRILLDQWMLGTFNQHLPMISESEIDHIHLSSEAQCVSHLYPQVDCHKNNDQLITRGIWKGRSEVLRWTAKVWNIYNSQGYGLGYMGVEFTSDGNCTKNSFLCGQMHKGDNKMVYFRFPGG